jgi:hypothetical protein
MGRCRTSGCWDAVGDEAIWIDRQPGGRVGKRVHQRPSARHDGSPDSARASAIFNVARRTFKAAHRTIEELLRRRVAPAMRPYSDVPAAIAMRARGRHHREHAIGRKFGRCRFDALQKSRACVPARTRARREHVAQRSHADCMNSS